jgi:hypothetical protein
MGTDFQPNPIAQATASGRLGSPGVVASVGPPLAAAPAVQVDVADVALRDRIRWGPIVAGIVAGFAMLLFLTVLGIALGISALSGDNPATWGTAAGIWGGLSLLVAFFFGGWMSARATTPVDDNEGALNGFITGAATLLVLVWLTTTAITGALGFFATTIADIAGAAAPVAMQAVEQGNPPAATNVETTVNQAVENPQNAVPPEADQAARAAAQTASQNAGPGAWGTAIAIALAIAAATLGGIAGQNPRWRFTRIATVVAPS